MTNSQDNNANPRFYINISTLKPLSSSLFTLNPERIPGGNFHKHTGQGSVPEILSLRHKSCVPKSFMFVLPVLNFFKKLISLAFERSPYFFLLSFHKFCSPTFYFSVSGQCKYYWGKVRSPSCPAKIVLKEPPSQEGKLTFKLTLEEPRLM